MQGCGCGEGAEQLTALREKGSSGGRSCTGREQGGPLQGQLVGCSACLVEALKLACMASNSDRTLSAASCGYLYQAKLNEAMHANRFAGPFQHMLLEETIGRLLFCLYPCSPKHGSEARCSKKQVQFVNSMLNLAWQ